jgi:hypothetical protein
MTFRRVGNVTPHAGYSAPLNTNGEALVARAMREAEEIRVTESIAATLSDQTTLIS